MVENSNWQQEHIQYPNVDWNQNASIVQMTDPSGSEASIRRWNKSLSCLLMLVFPVC